jgi:hypothetical protein
MWNEEPLEDGPVRKEADVPRMQQWHPEAEQDIRQWSVRKNHETRPTSENKKDAP